MIVGHREEQIKTMREGKVSLMREPGPVDKQKILQSVNVKVVHKLFMSCINIEENWCMLVNKQL